MKLVKTVTVASVVGTLLIVNGCASQREFRELETEVSTLRVLAEGAKADAQKALQESSALRQESSALRQELADVRQVSESAGNDAENSRRVLEQINTRLDELTTTSSLK